MSLLLMRPARQKKSKDSLLGGRNMRETQPRLSNTPSVGSASYTAAHFDGDIGIVHKQGG